MRPGEERSESRFRSFVRLLIHYWLQEGRTLSVFLTHRADALHVFRAQCLRLEGQRVGNGQHYYRKEANTINHYRGTRWQAQPKFGQWTFRCWQREGRTEANR